MRASLSGGFIICEAKVLRGFMRSQSVISLESAAPRMRSIVQI
jgi:hypothetical protein